MLLEIIDLITIQSSNTLGVKLLNFHFLFIAVKMLKLQHWWLNKYLSSDAKDPLRRKPNF